MATTVYHAHDVDGWVRFNNTTSYTPDSAEYAVTGLDMIRVGQSYNGGTGVFQEYQGLITFDLADPESGSAIEAGSTINSGTLTVYSNGGSQNTLWTMYVCRYDFSTSIDTGDGRTRAQMSSLYNSGSGLFASATVAADGHPWTDYTTVTFTSGSAMTSDIAARIGTTLKLIFFSSLHMAGTQPSVDEWVDFQSATKSGTNHAALSVDWSAPAGFVGMTVTKTLAG